MKGLVCMLLAGFALASCNASAQGRAAKGGSGDILIAAQWGTALAAAEHGRADIVLASLKTAMSDAVFPTLSSAKQYDVAELYGQAADQLGRWDDAHEGFQKASMNPQASNEDWDLRLHTASAVGLASDAWIAFDHLRGLHIPVLQTFGGRELQRFDALLGDLPNARAARLALGRQMVAEQRASLQGYIDESIVWAHFAEALLETGDTDGAKAAAGQVTDPVVLTELAADRRFDAVVGANPKLADPVAAAERYLAWAQDEAKAQPRLLSARIAVVRALTLLDRPEDALAAAQETARYMARGTREAPYFEDMPIEASFFETWKDSLLVRAGRGEEAVAGLTVATSCHCSALSAVELGQTLLKIGRAKEAEGWLHDVEADHLAIDDRLSLAEARACVAAELADSKTFDENLAFLRAHRMTEPLKVVSALVCANQLDAAAAELEAQLGDSRLRLTALRAVQTYAEPDHQPFSAQLRDRWSQLLARPAVRQVVDTVGRSATYKLQARGALA